MRSGRSGAEPPPSRSRRLSDRDDAASVGHAGRRFAATIETTGGADPVAFRLAGAKPAWLSFDAATGNLSGTAKLDPRKPRIVVKRTGKHVRRIVVARPPLPGTYSLYVTATDALGQRSTTAAAGGEALGEALVESIDERGSPRACR